MTREDVMSQLQRLATPIDFDALVAEGVLRKVGASYEVLNPKRLPEHVSAQATGVKAKTQRDGSQQVLLTFPKSNARAVRLYRRATGEDPYGA